MIGVVGYAVAGIYVVFSAPDLALTQLLIETLDGWPVCARPREAAPKVRRGATVALTRARSR